MSCHKHMSRSHCWMSLVPSSELELHSSIGSHTPHAPPEPVPEMTNVPSITGLIVELTFSKFVPIKNIIFLITRKEITTILKRQINLQWPLNYRTLITGINWYSPVLSRSWNQDRIDNFVTLKTRILLLKKCFILLMGKFQSVE